MAGDRKYRQQGYRDPGAEKQEPRQQGRPPSAAPAPASKMPASRSVSRCTECGTLLQFLAEPPEHCPKCGLALHSCKQCGHFDPQARFECAQPVPQRIPDKGARNDCALFSLRVTVERDTSSGSIRPEDARRTFDNLFKK